MCAAVSEVVPGLTYDCSFFPHIVNVLAQGEHAVREIKREFVGDDLALDALKLGQRGLCLVGLQQARRHIALRKLQLAVVAKELVLLAPVQQ